MGAALVRGALLALGIITQTNLVVLKPSVS